MSKLVDMPLGQWNASCSPAQQAATLQALEDGDVIVLPRLAFSLLKAECRLPDHTTELATERVTERATDSASKSKPGSAAGSAKNASWPRR